MLTKLILQQLCKVKRWYYPLLRDSTHLVSLVVGAQAKESESPVFQVFSIRSPLYRLRFQELPKSYHARLSMHERSTF